MLPQKEAFIFQQLYPKFSDTIYYTAVATRELLTIHARSGVLLSAPTQIDWEAMLDPFPFHLVFEEDCTPDTLISHIQQETPGIPNEWIYRIPHIWQCSRQLSLLIQQLETFFQALGFRGLHDLVHKVNLNTDTVRGTPSASDAHSSSASTSDSRLPSASAPATSSLFRNAFGRMTS